MQAAAAPSMVVAGGAPRTSAITMLAVVPFLACFYSLIFYPMLFVGCGPLDVECTLTARPENKIVWPLLGVTAAMLIAACPPERRQRLLAPNVVLLLAYVALAGASVLWAFNPGLSFIRFLQQAFVVTSIVLVIAAAERTSDAMRVMFACYALSVLLNIVFVNVIPPITIENATWGYPGYFLGKNYLGECAAIAIILALHEMFHAGTRRYFGAVVVCASLPLLVLSNSKTSIGLLVLAPALSLVAVIARRKLSVSPLALPVVLLAIYELLSSVSNFNIFRLSYMLYGDSSFTGRTVIWDFAVAEFAKRPLLGWGYQSFWLAGPGSPSLVDGPGWVKFMPHAHNGYLDARLELGLVGFAILIAFLAATLHGAGKVIDREPARGWTLLSLAFFVIITNGLESTWARGFEFPWVAFLFVAGDVAARSGGLDGIARTLPKGMRRERGGTMRGAFAPAARLDTLRPASGQREGMLPSPARSSRVAPPRAARSGSLRPQRRR